MKTCNRCGVEITDENSWVAKSRRVNGSIRISVMGICYPCKKAAFRDWYRVHADTERARSTKYNSAHREIKRAAYKRYYEKHRRRVIVRNAKWRADHREKRNATARMWWKKNKRRIRIQRIHRRIDKKALKMMGRAA